MKVSLESIILRISTRRADGNDLREQLDLFFSKSMVELIKNIMNIKNSRTSCNVTVTPSLER
ncbi:hypothetical protein D3C81_1165760 [compost metagenome]